MRDVLEKWDKGISICGRKFTNLRYADDTTLIAGTKDNLTENYKSQKSKRRSRIIFKCQEKKGDDYM